MAERGRSKKHLIFVAEYMEDKYVSDIAGLGAALTDRLLGQGYVWAYQVFGEFLANENGFEKWLIDDFGVSENLAKISKICLKTWRDRHFDKHIYDGPAIEDQHAGFIAEPMGWKVVSDIPGVDDDVTFHFEEKDYKHAFQVFGRFLQLNKEEDLFHRWLKDNVGANDEQAQECTNCIKEWCDLHFEK